LARENNIGWIRVEPANEEELKAIRVWTSDVQTGPKICGHRMSIIKAPHDVQPREVFIIDITKPEEQLLAEMKSKTRYNVKLAEKKGVKVWNVKRETRNEKYIDEFVRLTQVMAKRQGIVTHEKDYYRKMIEIVPESILKLYVAEYENKVIAANLVIFYGQTCTYLHGASDDSLRNVMAPFLLQWQQIKDAKAAGCTRYDFGGVKINLTGGRSWAGVTRFKTGFSPNTKPTEFPGCYDVIVSPVRYWGYRVIQKIKSLMK
jgi:lipid II:glycine glycyltransferase (peptidoglycan interpeptide bridge formation enzyme)